MWNRYFNYLDYLQIRRRIERRLSRSLWLFIHIAIFVITPLVVYSTTPWLWWNPGYPYVVDPVIGIIMAGWAVALLLHGLWTFFRSGAWGKRRNDVIEIEMRERVQNKDSYLVQDARDMFRLHGILDDDVRRSAGALITPLTLFTVANGLLWVVERGGTYGSAAWTFTPMLAILLLAILAWNLWHGRRHERNLRDLMASNETLAAKPKRDVLHLADDGEVLDIVEEEFYEKPKRASYSE